jgi:hypothetical protein
MFTETSRSSSGVGSGTIIIPMMATTSPAGARSA